MKKAHEIDYKLYGDDMQFVEIELDPGESVIAEAGALMYMEPGMQMETIFGDGSNREEGGVVGKLFGAGKRLITGESLFMTLFTNMGNHKTRASYAAPIRKNHSVNLSEYNGKIICQKDAFLCAAKGVSIGIEFQESLEPDFLAEKDLSCKSWRVTVSPFCMREERS